MVEYAFPSSLDTVFSALADPTRRDILHRVSTQQLTVTQLAQSYNLTFAAVSKHLKVLEKAMLVTKHRVGRKQYVSAQAPALKEAADYLEWYRQLWAERLDSLEVYLSQEGEQNGRS
jgi:DNA-binding transcriptional ArsR family regulator